MKLHYAKFFSTLFHFLILGPLGVIIIFINEPNDGSLWRWLFPALFGVVYVILPLFTFRKLKQLGKISDYDITVRQERHLANFIGLVYSSVFLVTTILATDKPIYLVNALFMTLFSLVYGLVTLFWKISYHMGGTAWFSAVMLDLFGFNLFLLIGLGVVVSLTGWSRITQQKHTFWQVLAGFVAAICIYLGSVWLVGRFF